MPVTIHKPEEREYIIESLSKEIGFFYAQIKKLYETDKVITEASECLNSIMQQTAENTTGTQIIEPFVDETQHYRRVFAFVAVLAMENNIAIRNLLLSKSETEELPIIKNGIITMQEGCKKLIGFYSKNGNDEMVTQSLLYQIYAKFETDMPEIYNGFVKHVGVFRDRLEAEDTKKLRDTLVHFQEGKGDFNPFNFIDDVFKIDVNNVLSILFSYCIFLRYTTQSLGELMKFDCK